MTKRVFITGAGGFIGRSLADALRSDGFVVEGIDDLSAPGACLGPGVRRQRVEDLVDTSLAGVDTVVHLAASKRVDTSFHDFDAVGRNVLADSHLFGLAYMNRVTKLMFASTCEVYGPSSATTNCEVAVPAPVSPYAVGKRASEQILLTTRDLYPSTDVKILRLFNVYGPDEALPAVIPAFVRSAHQGSPLTIQGSGLQERDFSFISDAVAMLATVVRAPSSPPIINVGSGVATSVAQIASLIATSQPIPCMITHGPQRPNEVFRFRSDTTLWQSTFGSVARRPVAHGIGQCVTSLRLRADVVARVTR